MAFKSEKHRRWMWATDPEKAREIADKLPKKKKKKSHRAEIVEKVKSDKVSTSRIRSGIGKVTVEQVLKRDVAEDATVPLWKNGQLTGSVIKKIWDMIDLGLIKRVEKGWKILPKGGYNKTTYWVSRDGQCSCQGFKVRGACSHALAVDVFVRLQKMGCAE